MAPSERMIFGLDDRSFVLSPLEFDKKHSSDLFPPLLFVFIFSVYFSQQSVFYKNFFVRRVFWFCRVGWGKVMHKVISRGRLSPFSANNFCV